MRSGTHHRGEGGSSSRTRIETIATVVTIALALLTLGTGSVGAVTQGETLAANETTLEPRTTAPSADDVPADGGSDAAAEQRLPGATVPTIGVGVVVGVVLAGMIVVRQESEE
jgi:hypothetical protein